MMRWSGRRAELRRSRLRLIWHNVPYSRLSWRGGAMRTHSLLRTTLAAASGEALIYVTSIRLLLARLA